MRRLVLAVAVLLSVALGASRADASSIYVIDAGYNHGQISAAVAHLNALGHTVTEGNTLGSYIGFDQVWDLRYQSNLLAGDIAAMGAYLQAGGRMYLTGEHEGFDGTRNTSLVAWAAGVGAGAMALVDGAVSGNQAITAAGQIVNSPNAFAAVNFGAARTTSSAGSGFLVTDWNQTGRGSLVGWDFGDIAGAAGARMLIGFDIEIFNNGQNWTQNMATFLGSGGQQAVPEPATMALVGAGLFGAARRLRRRTK